MPFVMGMVFSIPILLLYWSFFHSFFNNWTSTGLFFYYFFNKDGIFGIYIIAVLFALFILIEKPLRISRLREITAYTSGFYFTIALYDSLAAEAWYGSLELFLVPISRLATILLLSVLVNLSLNEIDWRRFLWMGLAFLVPVLMVFVPLLFVVNLSLISLVISILILIFSIFIYLLDVQGRLN